MTLVHRASEIMEINDSHQFCLPVTKVRIQTWLSRETNQIGKARCICTILLQLLHMQLEAIHNISQLEKIYPAPVFSWTHVFTVILVSYGLEGRIGGV